MEIIDALGIIDSYYQMTTTEVLVLSVATLFIGIFIGYISS